RRARRIARRASGMLCPTRRRARRTGGSRRRLRAICRLWSRHHSHILPQLIRQFGYRHGVIGQPLPDLALAEQLDAEEPTHRELFGVWAEFHLGLVDRAVARIEDVAVLVGEAL